METIYLAYETAWWYWQNAKNAPATLAVAKRHHALTPWVGGVGEMQKLLKGTLFGPQKLCVLLSQKGVHAASGIEVRTFRGKLPRGSFVQLSPGICIASPELSFLQAAQDMSLYGAILYGYALCGTFVLDATQESGTAPRAALTSVKKLAEFIDRCKGMRGYRAACTALRYILEGSASPRESKTAMLLYLPLCHGGYGLPPLSLNVEITVPQALRKLVGRKTLRADFYWKDARVAAEYDSDILGHTGSQGLCNDSTKRIALGQMGFSTFGFTRLQVDRLYLMDESVAALRKLLGVRKPQRLPHDYRNKQVRLRHELGLPL